VPPVPRSLDDWLQHVERQHPQAIALGLDRVEAVRERMGLGFDCPLFVVGGTNGKGSTCAMLEAILRAAGHRTGLYTSPHLLRYNERVRFGSVEASSEALAEGFGAVEAARGDVPLTYFEFGTLAAAWLFARERLDAVVLEVGLGGRLDAVNVFDADCAVLTGIDIDHVDYLGGTREAIGREKAGIFRSGRPAVVADPKPPQSVLDAAAGMDARLLLIGRDFHCRADSTQWRFESPEGRHMTLAYPALRGAIQLRNAGAAITALETLRERLPVAMQDIRRGLAEVSLPGRFQVLPGRPQLVLDVAHNPEAAGVLAANISASGFSPETIGVLGMLRDKDIHGVLRAIKGRITRWHLATLGGPRGADAKTLEQALRAAGCAEPASLHPTVAAALAAARSEAGEGDKIVVFGSFLTVAEAMAHTREATIPSHG